MPILRHEEASHRTIRQHHRNHGALRMDSQMPRMSERRLDHHPGRRHQNRDTQKERIYRENLEEANEEIRRIMNQRERLLLTITHDITPPAASISGFIDIKKK